MLQTMMEIIDTQVSFLSFPAEDQSAEAEESEQRGAGLGNDLLSVARRGNWVVR